MKKIALIASTGLWLAACQPQGQLTEGTTGAAIVGGMEDTGDPGVVAIYAKQPGADKGALCTAEIIAPTVVLTAAHCVSEDEVGVGAVWEVLTSTSLQGSKTRLRVKEVHHDPAFDAKAPQNGHDVGIAILEEPTAITPLPFLHNALPDTVTGQEVRLVGYGLSNAFAQTGAGIKRQVTTKIDGVDGLTIHVGDFFHDSCNGDSGGPAFVQVNGVETIAGVTSYGDIFCLLGGYYTRLDLYTSFIDQHVQAELARVQRRD